MKYFNLLFVCLFLAGISSCRQNVNNSETKAKTEVTISQTEKEINQLITDAYKAISFEKGTTPDYLALKSLFTPKATLYNFTGDSLNFYFIDDFIEEFKAGFVAGELNASTAFEESELGGETEYFGKVGHRVSAYVTKYNGADEAGERGINNFQVIKINGKWLINSIVSDTEKDGQAIPKRYITD